MIFRKLLHITCLVGGMIILTFNSFATDPEQKQNIYIHVKNVQAPKGAILVAIYDNEKDYMKTPRYSRIATVNDGGEVKIQAELPFGNYAFTLFHDVNSNMELDTNLFGIPKEPYGFSNNAKAPFGPPGFQAALVEFKEEGHEIEILLK
jgi:uncharacterized protein (DUF2141 family)